jgi:hypothetical protein
MITILASTAAGDALADALDPITGRDAPNGVPWGLGWLCSATVRLTIGVGDPARGGMQPGCIAVGIGGRSIGGAPQQGGTLSMSANSDIQHFDPAIQYDSVSMPTVLMLFDRLLGYDEGTNLVPELAEAMPTVSEDGKSYTFKLRKGANFVKPDGSVLREITADDVAYSINRVLDPDLKPNPSPVESAFFGNIVGATDVIAGTAELRRASRSSTPTPSTRPRQRRSHVPQHHGDLPSIVPKGLGWRTRQPSMPQLWAGPAPPQEPERANHAVHPDPAY